MSEAYKWLQTLPPHIREEIKSMEQGVFLYLKTKRLGGGIPNVEDLKSGAGPSTPQTPKASQEFQKNLKDLRVELAQFDFAPPQTNQPVNPQPQQQYTGHGFHQGQQQTVANPPPQPTVSHYAAPPTPAPVPEDTAAQLFSAMRLDPRSRHIITEIRDGLNLSSDLEVIRLSLVFTE